MKYFFMCLLIAATLFIDAFSQTTLIGSYYFPTGGNAGGAKNLTITDNFAYVVRSEALSILDISSPSSPQEINLLEINSPGGLARYGNYAYVSAAARGCCEYAGELIIYDFSAPIAPQELDFVRAGFSDNPQEVVISGNEVYTISGEGLYYFDISTPSSPQELGVFWTRPSEGERPEKVELDVEGNYAYIADADSGLRIIDVSGTEPLQVGKIITDGITVAVKIKDNFAYIADSEEGLRIIDISIPSTPQEVGFFNKDGINIVDVFISGNYALIADQNENGLIIVDVSDPSLPQEVDNFDTGGKLNAITIENNYIYLTDSETGVFIVQNSLVTDISEGQNELLPSKFELSQNYPNPFNPNTNIQFSIPQSSTVTLEVFNTLGEKIDLLVSEELNAGTYNYDWNASNLTSGIYFYKLQAGAFIETKKMILLK